MKNLNDLHNRLEIFFVENFRNLQSSTLHFSSTINCFLGENGHGKTNLLESLYYLLQRKSFRKNTSFPQMLSCNTDYFEMKLNAKFYYDFDSVFVKIHPNYSKGIWSYNQKIINTAPKWACIYVDPFDAQRFFHTPSLRREWFDQQFSQLNTEYKFNLKRYQQLLKMRNQLLVPPVANAKKQQLKAIDDSFSAVCAYFAQIRPQMLLEMQKYATPLFHEIFDMKVNLKLSINSRWPVAQKETYQHLLQTQLEKDIYAGKTTYGPHRDDILVHLDGLSALNYASLGQQKCSYLSLIFSFVENYFQMHQGFPIVLLDDISGELDQTRWKQLVRYLERREFQTFITTANGHFGEFLGGIKNAQSFEIINGQVSTKQK